MFLFIAFCDISMFLLAEFIFTSHGLRFDVFCIHYTFLLQ